MFGLKLCMYVYRCVVCPHFPSYLHRRPSYILAWPCSQTVKFWIHFQKPKAPLPQTQAFRSGFCLTALEKNRIFFQSCETKSGMETLGLRLPLPLFIYSLELYSVLKSSNMLVLLATWPWKGSWCSIVFKVESSQHNATRKIQVYEVKLKITHKKKSLWSIKCGYNTRLHITSIGIVQISVFVFLSAAIMLATSFLLAHVYEIINTHNNKNNYKSN